MAKVNPAIIMDMIEKGLSLNEPHNTLDKNGLFAAQNINYIESMNEVEETNTKNALIYIEEKAIESSEISELTEKQDVSDAEEKSDMVDVSDSFNISDTLEASEISEDSVSVEPESEEDKSSTKKTTKKQRKAKK